MKHLTSSLLIVLLILVNSCAPKISKYAVYNKMIENQYTHVINDSIEAHIALYGDYKPILEPKNIQNSFKNKPFLKKKEILFYATNTVKKDAELYITISDEPLEFKKLPSNVSIDDTLAGQNFITFIKINNSEVPFNRISLNDDYAQHLPTVIDVVQNTSSSNKYLKILNDINILSEYDKDNNWQNLQYQLTYASFLGENNPYYRTGLKKLFKKFSPTINDTIVDILRQKAMTENVPQKIADIASENQVLMINENHFFPKDRLLLIDLLPLLKEKGFTHLALEALTESEETKLNQANAHPTQKSGFYIREQHYANAVRLAQKLGFKFVAYESENEDRENGQAENLYDKTWALNPDAKVIVWAGLSHIYEKPNQGKKYLATLLKEKYNINPLTISQTQLVPYEKHLDATYALIEASDINEFKKDYTDYLLVNKQTQNLLHSTMFKNIFNEEVQLSLFYVSEIEKAYQLSSRVPYFTAYIDRNHTVKIPSSNNNFLLVIYDKFGNVLEKRTY
ncbi:hypothetical protein GO491_08400 [Flavobacteriaceae bacterium Ap0902]|nr:hypothetical protein [Flavobacteriaceae bacterium Ap0902]